MLMVRCLCQRQFIMQDHRLMSRYKGLFTTRRVVLSQNGCGTFEGNGKSSFWQQKNNLLLCYAFDSRQILHQIQIESSLLWPAFEMVSAQISLWVKHCFDGLPASLQEHF